LRKDPDSGELTDPTKPDLEQCFTMNLSGAARFLKGSKRKLLDECDMKHFLCIKIYLIKGPDKIGNNYSELRPAA
jgi:hypothetical protein